MPLTREEIHSTIKSLAQSQGLYERILHSSKYEELLDFLVTQKFEDVLELITAIEC